MKSILLLVGVIFSLTAKATIPNEAIVENQITRGGRPALSDIDGFKTIINIETKSKAVEAERSRAAQLGIQFVQSEMSAYRAPTDQQIQTIINLMKDKNNQPLFIHCLHGEDRTGLVVGLYRVYVDGWTPDAAYQEMLEKGFHPSYTALKNYFFAKTKIPTHHDQ